MGGINVTNLRYADDIVLLAGSLQELEILVTRVKKASEQSGLLLNTQKTKVMKMIGDPTNIDDRNLVVNGETIDTVREFNYLGATIIYGSLKIARYKRNLVITKLVITGAFLH